MKTYAAIVASIGTALAINSSAAEPPCKQPLRVNSIEQVNRSTLALRNVYGPAAIDSSCVILERGLFGSTVNFFILPQSVENTDTVRVYVKSYRTLSNEPVDRIKVSRGGSWFFPSERNGLIGDLDRNDDEPFLGTVDAWNKAHSTAAKPEVMEDRLELRWHAYADSGKRNWSSQRAEFWKAREKFDFSRGTLTNYLIRFPSGGKTPARFDVGLALGIKEFELEIYSNAEGLSGTYRFVVQ